jgi:hypothetical protein
LRGIAQELTERVTPKKFLLNNPVPIGSWPGLVRDEPSLKPFQALLLPSKFCVGNDALRRNVGMSAGIEPVERCGRHTVVIKGSCLNESGSCRNETWIILLVPEGLDRHYHGRVGRHYARVGRPEEAVASLLLGQRLRCREGDDGQSQARCVA